MFCMIRAHFFTFLSPPNVSCPPQIGAGAATEPVNCKVKMARGVVADWLIEMSECSTFSSAGGFAQGLALRGFIDSSLGFGISARACTLCSNNFDTVCIMCKWVDV